MNRLAGLGRLRGNRNGSVVVEFALLAPVLLVAMIGVMQAGMATWRYNALRALSSDIARFAVVQYQSDDGVDPSTTTLETWGVARGTGQAYQIAAADLDVDVVEVDTPQVTGTVEMTITVEADIPALLPFNLFDNLTLSYERPVILLP